VWAARTRSQSGPSINLALSYDHRAVDGAPAQDRLYWGGGVRDWVTYHGLALNVDPDLSGFDAIIACGLGFAEMTSIARELAAAAPADLAARARAAVRAACANRWR
jgi:hypothetical protein